MQFSELKNELKELPIDEKRMDCDNYFEAVVSRHSLTELNFILQRLLGDPVWPSKSRLSFQMEQAIRTHGGVMTGQTLYFWAQGSDEVFAMLWPWKDGNRVTVKVAKKADI